MTHNPEQDWTEQDRVVSQVGGRIRGADTWCGYAAAWIRGGVDMRHGYAAAWIRGGVDTRRRGYVASLDKWCQAPRRSPDDSPL